jgi:hypothetical protein
MLTATVLLVLTNMDVYNVTAEIAFASAKYPLLTETHR